MFLFGLFRTEGVGSRALNLHIKDHQDACSSVPWDLETREREFVGRKLSRLPLLPTGLIGGVLAALRNDSNLPFRHACDFPTTLNAYSSPVQLLAKSFH